MLLTDGSSLSCVQLFATPWTVQFPWTVQNSPGQNTRVGSVSLLQEIFPTQWSNPGLPRCGQILYQLNHKGSPKILEYGTSSPALQADSLPTELPGKPDGPQRERIIWEGSSGFSESWDTIWPCQLTDRYASQEGRTNTQPHSPFRSKIVLWN